VTCTGTRSGHHERAADALSVNATPSARTPSMPGRQVRPASTAGRASASAMQAPTAASRCTRAAAGAQSGGGAARGGGGVRAQVLCRGRPEASGARDRPGHMQQPSPCRRRAHRAAQLQGQLHANEWLIGPSHWLYRGK